MFLFRGGLQVSSMKSEKQVDGNDARNTWFSAFPNENEEETFGRLCWRGWETRAKLVDHIGSVGRLTPISGAEPEVQCRTVSAPGDPR